MGIFSKIKNWLSGKNEETQIDDYDYDFYNEMKSICIPLGEDKYEYKLDENNNAIINRINSKKKSVIIPSELNGHTVVCIKMVDYLTKNIIIPSCVEEVNYQVLEGKENVCFEPNSKLKIITVDYEFDVMVNDLKKINLPKRINGDCLLMLSKSEYFDDLPANENGEVYINNTLIGYKKSMDEINSGTKSLLNLGWINSECRCKKVIINKQVENIISPNGWKYVDEIVVNNNPHYLLRDGAFYKKDFDGLVFIFMLHNRNKKEFVIEDDVFYWFNPENDNIEKIIIKYKYDEWTMIVPFDARKIKELEILNPKLKLKTRLFTNLSDEAKPTIKCYHSSADELSDSEKEKFNIIYLDEDDKVNQKNSSVKTTKITKTTKTNKTAKSSKTSELVTDIESDNINNEISYLDINDATMKLLKKCVDMMGGEGYEKIEMLVPLAETNNVMCLTMLFNYIMSAISAGVRIAKSQEKKVVKYWGSKILKLRLTDQALLYGKYIIENNGDKELIVECLRSGMKSLNTEVSEDAKELFLEYCDDAEKEKILKEQAIMSIRDCQGESVAKLKEALTEYIDINSLAKALYIENILMDRGETYDIKKLSTQCSGNNIKAYFSLDFIDDKIKQKKLELSESEKEVHIEKLLSFFNEEVFSDWQEFWAKVICSFISMYDIHDEKLGQCMLDTVSNRQKYSKKLIHCFGWNEYIRLVCEEKMDDVPELEDLMNDCAFNQGRMNWHFGQSGEQMPKYNKIEEIKDVLEDSVNGEFADEIEEANLGTKLEPKNNNISIRANGIPDKVNSQLVRVKIPVWIKTDKKTVSASDFYCDGMSNMIRSGIVANISDDSCCATIGGNLTVGDTVYTLRGNITIGVPYQVMGDLIAVYCTNVHSKKGRLSFDFKFAFKFKIDKDIIEEFSINEKFDYGTEEDKNFKGRGIL